MPSSQKALQTILANLKDENRGKVYELGCGFGTLAFPLAEKLPDHEIIGYETSTFPFLISKLRLIFSRQSNLRIIKKDFVKANLQDAHLVVCYLYPKAMQRLKIKFEQELPKGSWVISNTFAIPGRIPHKTIKINDLYNSNLYIYRFD